MIWEFQSIYASKKDDWINMRFDSDMLSERSTLGDLSMKCAQSHKDLLYANDVERNYINHFLNKQGIEEYISGDLLSEDDDEMTNHSRRSGAYHRDEEENQCLLTPYEA